MLKEEVEHLIAVHPHVTDFLDLLGLAEDEVEAVPCRVARDLALGRLGSFADAEDQADDGDVDVVVANEEDVYIAGVADQVIVDGNRFIGSKFPSTVNGEQRLKLWVISNRRQQRIVLGEKRVVDETALDRQRQPANRRWRVTCERVGLR